jgi:regulation of enolase protein 1 (concanavalin A-like superfamily)
MDTTIYVGVAVTSHVDGVIGSAVFDNVSVGEASPGWSSGDVGSVGATGAASVEGSMATVTGSGADIWNSADAFRYAYTQVNGNFVFTARVTGIENVDQWTKAGVMIRSSTSAESTHASLFATPTSVKGLAFQRRTISGGPSVHTPGPSDVPSVWLRLSRQGATVTAEYRKSGSDAWTTIGSDWIPDLPDAPLVGIAVSSHRDGVLATATFDNVSVLPVP